MIFTSSHATGTLPAGSRADHPRRGVLLLVVISMLTLFLMLGTTFMVVTSRAKSTARAFARASATQASASDAAGRRMVDDAFRILARGTTDAACKELSLTTGDDLLGDKYGKTFPAPNVRGRYGRIEGCVELSGGVLELKLVNPISLPPVSVNGRIVTLTFPGMCQSRRILSATGTPAATSTLLIPSVSPVDGTTISVADVQRGMAATAAAPNVDHIVINGREFAGDPLGPLPPPLPFGLTYGVDTNESYDGLGTFANDQYDEKFLRDNGLLIGGTEDKQVFMTDPFLASLVATDASDQPFDVNETDPTRTLDPNVIPSKVAVRKMSFFEVETDLANPTNVPEVDNDADGVLDSKWIDVGFPVMRTADGTTFRARPAYLVLDLDSRLSLNAHGNAFQIDALLTSAGVGQITSWPASGSALPGGLTDAEFNDLPFGSGYGPAEVRLWDLFFKRPGFLPDLAGNDKVSANDAGLRGDTVMYGRPTAETRAQTNQLRPTITVSDIEGRYGYDITNGGGYVPPGAPNNDPQSVIRDEERHPLHAASTGIGSANFRTDRGGDDDDDQGEDDDDDDDDDGHGGGGSSQSAARFPQSLTDSWRAGTQPSDLDGDPGLYTSPSDLSGRMKVVVDSSVGPGDQGIVSKMWYAKPENYWQADITDDAYEIQLGRPSAFDNPFKPDELERVLRAYDWDASQLPTRLAGLLGADAERLRLLLTSESWDTTAIVGDTWRQMEDVLTTRGFNSAQLADLLGPELMTGRRLDLNRQITLADGTSAARRDALCRNLYVLLWTLADDTSGNTPTPAVCEAIAQWAVNVVDYRDPDSTMTRFFYDLDPSDGWDIDPASSPIVLGQERPDLLLTEALCWKNDAGDEGGVHVVLHHPWAAKALDGDTVLPAGTPAAASDPLDPDAVAPELAARDPNGVLMNEIDLGKRGGNDPNSPVWRLRVGAGASAAVIRFDHLVDPSVITIDPTRPQYSSSDSDPQARFVPADGWIAITGNRGTAKGGNPQIAVSQQLVIDQMDGIPTGPLPSANAGTTDQVLVLERLADPSVPHNSDESDSYNPLLPNDYDPLNPFNPYVEVDRIESVPVANRSELAPPGSGIPKNHYAKQSRKLSQPTLARFWQRDHVAVGDPVAPLLTDPTAYDPAKDERLDRLSPPAGQKVAWFPWLNRPFVNPVELVFVPSALVEYDTNAQRYRSRLLEDYTGFTTTNGWLDALATDTGLQADVLVNDLLQATIVPSRFSALGMTAADPSIFLNAGTGLEWLAINHFTGWREPGRVNLNTVTDDRVWDATVRRGSRPTSQTTPDPLDRLSSSGVAKFGLSRDPTTPVTPAENLLDLCGLDAGAGAVFADSGSTGQEPDANPQLQCLTAGRLANVATNRSNVFAIWITVGFFECNANGSWPVDANNNPIMKELGSDTGEVQRHRGFYVFDRSIPVGYETGRDLNLEDAVRLRRIIQ